MYINLYDSHIHSDNSHDGHHSVDALCRRALELGFTGLAITDHVEAQGLPGVDYHANIQKSIRDARRAQEEHDGKLDVICGLELAQIMQDLDYAEEFVDRYEYDFIIGSHHGVGGETIPDFRYWMDIDPAKCDIRERVAEYYRQLIDVAKWGRFDVLGHLTYPVRYVWGKFHVPLDFDLYMDHIRELLGILIHSGKGIEINTSGLRQGIGRTMPDLPLLKYYRQMGGEIVTIGSDAHFVEHVGLGVAESMDLMKEAGFKYFAHYKNRRPRMTALA